MSKQNKEKNEESKISKFKELWANPRYKALIKLGMYAVFFLTLFLISYISGSIKSSNRKNNSNDIKTLNILDNYSYIYTITTIKSDIIETITYTGTETPATNSGKIEYSYIDKVDNYVVDKTTNKIYINGVEEDKLYDLDDESYFSLNDVNEKILKSEKISENRYVYTDENNIKINITLEKIDEKQIVTIDFNERYISEIIDEKKLVLQYMSIK